MNLTALSMQSERRLLEHLTIGQIVTVGIVDSLNDRFEQHYGDQRSFYSTRIEESECFISLHEMNKKGFSIYDVAMPYIGGFHRLLTNLPTDDHVYHDWRTCVIRFYPGRILVHYYYYDGPKMKSEFHLLIPSVV